MKKIALFIIGLMAIMSLTACGGNTTELAELRNQVNSLEDQVNSLEDQVNSWEAKVLELDRSESIVTEEESIPEKEITASTDTLTEAAESNTTTVETNMQMSEYLDNQAISNNPVNWLEVANCDFATEKNLLEVAKKCTEYFYLYHEKDAAVDLAEAISKNPNCTDSVMQELINSEFIEVWFVIANSASSKEAALQLLAKKCAENFYMFYEKDTAVDLAEAISKNPNCTDSVMQELVNSAFPEVVSIGHQWIEN